jgi:hypothetical protein
MLNRKYCIFLLTPGDRQFSRDFLLHQSPLLDVAGFSVIGKINFIMFKNKLSAIYSQIVIIFPLFVMTRSSVCGKSINTSNYFKTELVSKPQCDFRGKILFIFTVANNGLKCLTRFFF